VSEIHTYEPCPRCGAIRGTVEDANGTRVSIPKECRDFEHCRDGRPLIEDDPLERDFELTPAPREQTVPAINICVAMGCSEEIPATRDWCSRHYGMIPQALKAPIWHARNEHEKADALAKAKAAVEQREFGERLL
jgi:hypothetical protein